MTNGRSWSKQDDALLKQTIETHASTLALATKIGRTHVALMARAKRIGIATSLKPMAASADEL